MCNYRYIYIYVCVFVIEVCIHASAALFCRILQGYKTFNVAYPISPATDFIPIPASDFVGLRRLSPPHHYQELLRRLAIPDVSIDTSRRGDQISRNLPEERLLGGGHRY